MKLRFIGAVLVFGLGLTGAAQADVLGTRQVSYGSETDVIYVGGQKTWARIRICVHRHAVRFQDLDVFYGNGGQDDIPIARVIPRGECSRWIDLNGPRRIIDKVVLKYDTFGNAGPRAVVSVRGQ